MRAGDLVARTSPCSPTIEPLCHAGSDAIVWKHGRFTLVAWGCVLGFRPPGGDERYAAAAARVNELFTALRVEDGVRTWGTGPIAFGSFAFDPDSDDSRVIVPSTVLGSDGERTWVTTIGHECPPPSAPPAVEHSSLRTRRQTSPDEERRWIGAVVRARECIRDGLIEKVVLAREARVNADAPFDRARIARRLAERYPSCYVFSFDGLVGASPELLVRRLGSDVESLVLAGSASRGRTPSEDDHARAALLTSQKDRREHDLAVASVRDSLTSLTNELSLDEIPGVVRLRNVQHLATKARGRLSEPVSALEVVGRLHPTAAVCGAPTDKALATIRELEDIDRRRYCGPIGWTDARGDGEWAVALRCAEINGRTARAFAGNGIMGDSDPEAELAETELKFSALLAALGTKEPAG